MRSPRIERDLTKLVVADLGISLDTLFYDTTNFFTYIDPTQCPLRSAPAGATASRSAPICACSVWPLLVSRDEPEADTARCTQIYGRETASTRRSSRPRFRPSIRSRLADLSLIPARTSLLELYDRGNLSQKNQHMIDEATVRLHVSAFSVPAQHRDLMAIPLSDYQHIQTSGSAGKGLRVHRTTKTVWGAQRTVVLYLSEMPAGRAATVPWVGSRGWLARPEGPPMPGRSAWERRDPDRAHPVPPNGASTASSPPSSSSRSCPSPMMAARPRS